MTLTTGTATSFITFSRASTATRINASGLVESVASGASRIDYDPVTRSAKGLLTEEQRTNTLIYSEQFDNAAWPKNAANVTANAGTDPSGSTSADKFVEDTTASSTHTLLQYASFTSGISYTFSVYAKAAERSVIILQFGAAAFSSAPSAWFDLTSGTVSKTTGTPATTAIQNVGGGWFRCTLVATCTTTYATAPARIYLDISPTGGSAYTGDGSSGAYVWGAQLEVGTFPTSYIPTTSATATRSVDVATIATSSFPYSTSEGTWVVAFQTVVANTSPSTMFIMAYDGSTSKRVLNITGNSNVAISYDGASNLVATGSVTGTASKAALAYDATNRYIVSNGRTVATGTVAAGFTTATTVGLGNSGSGTSPFSGWIRQVTYLPRRLSSTELQTRTA